MVPPDKEGRKRFLPDALESRADGLRIETSLGPWDPGRLILPPEKEVYWA